MSISERLNSDQLNIHQFQEVPERTEAELPFDVDRDISEEVKQKILEEVKRITGSLYYDSEANIDVIWLVGMIKAAWPNEEILSEDRLSNIIVRLKMELEQFSVKYLAISYYLKRSELQTNIDITPWYLRL